MVSQSHSRIQGDEAKTTAINLDSLGTVKGAVDGRHISNGFGGCLEEIKSLEDDLSRVESPPMDDRSNFVSGAQDDDIILPQGTRMTNLNIH